MNNSLKSGQEKKKEKKKPKRKTTRQPIIHPIVCFQPFLDPFIHQQGWGEGLPDSFQLWLSWVYNLEWMPKTCELRLLERNKTKQNKSQTTRNSETSKEENNSPYLVYNILIPQDFVFLNTHFWTQYCLEILSSLRLLCLIFLENTGMFCSGIKFREIQCLAENSEALKTRIPVVGKSLDQNGLLKGSLPTLFSAVLKIHPLRTCH